MTKLEEDKIHVEIQKLLSENRKLMAEQQKLLSDNLLNVKKIKWYEIVLIVGGILATATILTKL